MASITYEGSRDLRKAKAAETRIVPSVDWKKVLLKTFKEVGDDRVTLVAGGVTYFLLLALFPSVTAFISIYGLFVDPSSVGKQLDLLAGVIPAGGLDIVRDQLLRIIEQGTPTLGWTLIISLGLALWSSSSGVKAMFEAMNVAYDQTERRNFLVLNAVALAFTLAGVVTAAVMLGVVVAIPAMLSVLGFSKGVEWLVQIGGYLVMAIVLLTGIAALYRFGPSPHGAKWRWITPGAILALIFIGIVSAIFSWYAANIGHFDQTYGSLGALLGFLFWMWVCLIAVIVGAELNSELDDLAKSQASAVTSDKAFGADPVNQVATSGRRRESTAELSAAKRSIPAKQVGLTLAGAVPLLLLIGILGIGRRRIGG